MAVARIFGGGNCIRAIQFRVLELGMIGNRREIFNVYVCVFETVIASTHF
jgi:hypothetical protein